MKIISHRALLDGFDKSRENNPHAIQEAILLGFNVEIDIRYIKGKYYLGHDEADYLINLNWIVDKRDSLLIHCKDTYSAYELSNCAYRLRYFIHYGDDFALINGGYIWCHNRKLATNNKCLTHLINKKDVENWHKYRNIYGVITDYPIYLQELINE